MRILTISLNAWNDTQATGNTFSNFFGNASSDIEFANIYCRQEPIYNNLCKKYFRVTEKDIIKSLLFRKSCGFKKIDHIDNIESSNKRNTKFSWITNVIAHKFRPAVLLFAREFIWATNKWKSSTLKEFIEDFNPDIIYMHGHNNCYMHHILWFSKEVSNAKIALFFGDDMYGYKSKLPLNHLYQSLLRKTLRKSINKADLLLGGSFELCSEYSSIFKREFLPQFKTCSLPNCSNKQFFPPYSIVYAGNLLYGRKTMLKMVANAVDEVNKQLGRIAFTLNIYSNNSISNSDRSYLDNKTSSFLNETVPYERIRTILNNCDISLFVESFKFRDILNTRLSFSTKIIDYIQSSSGLIVLGPKNISSVNYLVTSGIGIYVDSKQSIISALKDIFSNPEILTNCMNHKREIALKNHSKHLLINRLKECLN